MAFRQTAAVRRFIPAAVLAALSLAAPGSVSPSAIVQLPRATAIHVPPGFRTEVYARGLEHPTAMAFGPGGRLFVTQEGGEVVRVTVGSSRPTVVAGGFRSPLGLAWRGRTLFVSTQGTLWRVAGGRKHAVVSHLPYHLHQQDNVVVMKDGRLVFGSGSTCNACREKSRLSATILSVRPDGTGLKVVARGLRNAFGLALQPRTGRLYASVNGRDDLGDGEPAEAVVEVRPGRNFGWPACWPSAAHLRLAGRCAGVTPPVAYLEPHSSADGMVFYDGRSFPAGLRGDIFVAEWGTYFGHRHGRRVVRVVLDRAGRARVSVFARGFDHPLAVAVDRLGALLVADYGRGRIYRIQASGKR
jgi:glucose/arabinose dehydrogenase